MQAQVLHLRTPTPEFTAVERSEMIELAHPLVTMNKDLQSEQGCAERRQPVH